MSFKIEVTGIEQTLEKFSKLPEKAADAAALSLYEGAAIVADAVSNAVQGIATEPFKYRKNGTRLPSPEEKAMLMNARKGVAKFHKNKMRVDTSVGFQSSGYAPITWNHARTNTRTKYKQQASGRYAHASQGGGESSKPIPLIANAIESGTSFMKKQPFFRRAVSKSKGQAQAAIEQGFLSREDMLKID